MQCASVRITNAPKRRPSSTATSLIKFKSQKQQPQVMSCLDPDFSPRSRTNQPDQPKIPRPSSACRPLAAQHSDKNLFFEPATTTRHLPPLREPPAYHEIRRCPLRLVACVSSVLESFHPFRNVLRDRGRRGAWCVVRGGRRGRSALCQVVDHLATFAPVFSEKYGPGVCR